MPMAANQLEAELRQAFPDAEIVIEDLAVKNMTRRKPGAGKGGRGLNRAVSLKLLPNI